MAAKIPNDIFQYSTTGALQAGYSSHGPIVRHLQGYGTHGIGVCSNLDGTLLLIDSQAHQVKVDHQKDGDNAIQKPPSDAGLAFVMVTKFVPEYQLTISGQLEKDALLEIFSSQGPDAGGKNSFMPFRVRGEFARVGFETASKGCGRGLPRENQSAETRDGNNVSDVKGTIFGFIGPACFASVSVTGVHCCFLSDAAEDGKRVGGILVDFQAKGDVELSWAVTGRFHIGFPRGETWEALDIPKTTNAD